MIAFHTFKFRYVLPMAAAAAMLLAPHGAAAAGAATGSLQAALETMGLTPTTTLVYNFENSIEPSFAAPGFNVAGKFLQNDKAAGPDAARFATAGEGAGQGVAIEEASSNLLGGAASGNWTGQTPDGALPLLGANLSVAATGGELGTAHCLHIDTPGKHGGEGFFVKVAPAAIGTAGGSLTASLSLRGKGRLRLQLFDFENYSPGPALYCELLPGWQRFILPALQMPAAPNSDVRLLVETADTEAAQFDAGELQVEPISYATSWMVGGSSRPEEKIIYKFADPNAGFPEGTALLWVKLLWTPQTELSVGDGPHPQPRVFMMMRPAAMGMYWTIYNNLFMLNGNGAPRIKGDDPGTGGRHFFAITWGPNGCGLYHNGEGAEGTTPFAVTGGNTIELGPNANAVFDQLVILHKALSKDQIKSLWLATK